MIHLIYISSATSWPTERDLTELLEQARARNIRQNITGMLLYGNATYMQLLEGEEKDVHEIYGAIKKDPRNNSVVTLLEEGITERDFPDWSMGFRNLTACSPGELAGFSDIFQQGLDKGAVLKNNKVAKKLLLNFATNV
ncbi:BLUF domain-containing protein [Thalassomonas actiniarum]|uniref:BLUF domain-containing protein n=1 Tax=Thalassomonas actiniarum TaxID=485447 RepID=A0AAE9YUZ5_9GAMM|nr:BLUF domain-containing protein [Thalassomonas actiniarum]WDE01308.1 BLUF domain-containing protein [Thalassomonas actiniarum]